MTRVHILADVAQLDDDDGGEVIADERQRNSTELAEEDARKAAVDLVVETGFADDANRTVGVKASVASWRELVGVIAHHHRLVTLVEVQDCFAHAAVGGEWLLLGEAGSEEGCPLKEVSFGVVLHR